ncbi:MAG: YihA family ribosome biogenesis GTP-binding protein [Paludibacteraceae bacterium]|nr:YihA family ribosome biogenesis GTP-binding protein [Paludibacteraceae bacterium]
MIIKSATFVKSSPTVAQCPNTGTPEYAFIGRSNVGKSSLINTLTGIKGLALTGSTPGKTLLINHFLVNGEWHIVDLPGYGFAQRGKKQREELRRMIEGYILGREQLTNLFLLIDSRLEPQQIDLEFIEWLGENGVPFSIVFTKADKLTKTALNTNIENYKERLKEDWEQLPPIFITSSQTRDGREEILNYIEQINASITTSSL